MLVPVVDQPTVLPSLGLVLRLVLAGTEGDVQMIRRGRRAITESRWSSDERCGGTPHAHRESVTELRSVQSIVVVMLSSTKADLRRIPDTVLIIWVKNG